MAMHMTSRVPAAKGKRSKLLGFLLLGFLCATTITTSTTTIANIAKSLAPAGPQRKFVSKVPPMLPRRTPSRSRPFLNIIAGITLSMAISLDTQAEINPLRLYGNFCGPNPEINQIKSACKDPFHREPMDAADAVCYRHDMRYCNCDAKLTSSGRDKLWWLGQDKGPYMSVRTLIPDFIAAKLIDTEYLRCLHNADVALVKEKGQLEREGGLPVKDKAAMAKMKTFQVIFEADLQADERWMKNRGERIDGN